MLLVFKKILSKEELEDIYKKAIIDIQKWFENNPKRKICRTEWIYGESFKVRRKHVKEDIEKMYKKTILDTFKN
jgi:hypothetical protein